MSNLVQSSDHLVFTGIDPVVFTLGSTSLRWYSLLYLVGFILVAYLAHRRLPRTQWHKSQLIDLLFWCYLAALLGGRIGYVLFYQFSLFVHQPAYLLQFHHGGMAFHGSLVAVIMALLWRAKKMNTSYLALGDFLAPCVPIGLAAGHIGNFINDELWGRVSSLPWAIVFPNAGPQPRHPSQLYEFAVLGLLLFVLLWVYSATARKTGAVSGLFLLAYGMLRLLLEFAREPDAHLGLYAVGISQGQLLSIPMIVAGIALLRYSRKQTISEGAGELIK